MEALRRARIGGEIGFAGLALLAGAAFGAAAAAPEVGAGAAAYSVVGMAAVAAAALGAPIVFELTGKHNVAVAVMIAVAASTLACRRAAGASWFALQLAERAATARRRA